MKTHGSLWALWSLLLLAPPVAGPAMSQPQIEDWTQEDATEEDATDAPELPSGSFDAFVAAYDDRLRELEAAGLYSPPEDVLAEVQIGESEARDREQVQNAATPILGTAAATTKFDAVSRLVAGIGLGDLLEDGETLVLRVNPEFLDRGPGQGSAQVSLSTGEVSELVAMAFPEDRRDGGVAALEKRLDEFDDIEVSLMWTLENGFFGRDPQDYARLTNDLFSQAGLRATRQSDASIQRLLAALDSEGGSSEETNRLAGVAGRNRADATARLQTLYKEEGYLKVGDLIDNQPQLSLDLVGTFHDEIAGRDEVKLVVAYEQGFANINQLRKACRTEGEDSLKRREVGVGALCYVSYLSQSAVDWSKRFRFTLEYEHSPSFDFQLPDDDISLSLDSAHRICLSGAYGFDLPDLNQFGDSPPRLDFGLRYETVSDDDVRNDDRLVSSLSLSQKLGDGSTATLALVYANEPEFLGEVDDQLSTQLGLKWSLGKSD